MDIELSLRRMGKKGLRYLRQPWRIIDKIEKINIMTDLWLYANEYPSNLPEGRRSSILTVYRAAMQNRSGLREAVQRQLRSRHYFYKSPAQSPPTRTELRFFRLRGQKVPELTDF